MSSGEMEESDLGLVNLDWSCEGCQVLKQQLAKSQEDHMSNYTTLKQKIISTDLLIKKFKTKCDKYDSQTKKLEETTKKLEKSQRDCQTLEQQMKVALEQLEPLKKANATLAKEKSRQGQQMSMLKDKLQAAEQLQKQYQQLTLESDKYKKSCEQKTEASEKRLHNLEISSKKQESTIARLKESLNQKKLKLDEAKKSNKKLESELAKITKKADRFCQILLRHGLLPKGEQTALEQEGSAEPWHPCEGGLLPKGDNPVQEQDGMAGILLPAEEDGEGETSSGAEEGKSHSFVPELLSEEEEEEESAAMTCEELPDKFNMADIFSDILRFVELAPISPLAPSPLDSDQDSNVCSAAESAEEDELDKFAGLLESEILPSNNEQMSVDDNSSQNADIDVEDQKEHVETMAQAESKELELEAEDIEVSKTTAKVEISPFADEKALNSPKKKNRKCFLGDQMPKLTRRLSPMSVRLPSLLEDEVMENGSESRTMPFPADAESLSDSDNEDGDGVDPEENAGKITRQGTTEFVVSKDVELESVGGSSTDQDALYFETHSPSTVCLESQENVTKSDDHNLIEGVNICDKTGGSLTASQCHVDCSLKSMEQESIPEISGRNILSGETSENNNTTKSAKEQNCDPKEHVAVPSLLNQGNSMSDSKLEQRIEMGISGFGKQENNSVSSDVSSPTRILNVTEEETKKNFSLSDIQEMSIAFGLLSRKKRKRCSSEPSGACIRQSICRSRSNSSSPVKKAFNRQRDSREVIEPLKGFTTNLSSAFSKQSEEKGGIEKEKRTPGGNKASPRQLRRSARLSKGHHVSDQDKGEKVSVSLQEVKVFSKEITGKAEDDRDGISEVKAVSERAERESYEVSGMSAETHLPTKIVTPRRITRSSAKTERIGFEKSLDKGKTGVVQADKQSSPSNVTRQRRITRSLIRQTSEGWLEDAADDTKTNAVDVSENVVGQNEKRTESDVQIERKGKMKKGSCSGDLAVNLDMKELNTEKDRLDKSIVGDQKVSPKNGSKSELEADLHGTDTVAKAAKSEGDDGIKDTVNSLSEDPLKAMDMFVVDANDNISRPSEVVTDLNSLSATQDLQEKDNARLMEATAIDASSDLVKDNAKLMVQATAVDTPNDSPVNDDSNLMMEGMAVDAPNEPSVNDDSKLMMEATAVVASNGLPVNNDAKLMVEAAAVDAPNDSSLKAATTVVFDAICDNDDNLHKNPPLLAADNLHNHHPSEENIQTLPLSTDSVISHEGVENPSLNSETLEWMEDVSEQSAGTRHDSQSSNSACTDSNSVAQESTEYPNLRPRTSALPFRSTFVPIYIPTSAPASSVPSVIRQSTSSITVVSPETSGPAMGGSTTSSLSRSATPSSNSSCSISASSPVSPLPPSPFEYLNIIPISPLPPSPVPAEPLSPLPSSPSRETEELEDTLVEEHTLEAMDVGGEVSPERNTVAVLQPTPLPQAITPLPITPSEATHRPVTPLSHTPTSDAAEHATHVADVTPISAGKAAVSSKPDPRSSTSRHPSGEVGPSRRNLELCFSDNTAEQLSQPTVKQDLNTKCTKVASAQKVLEDEGGVSLLRAKKRISHYKPTDTKLDGGNAQGCMPAPNERKKRKSSGGNGAPNTDQTATFAPQASGDIQGSQEGAKQRKKHSSGRRTETEEVTDVPYPGGDHHKLSNEDIKNQAVCIGGKKRKSSDGGSTDFAQKVVVLNNGSSSSTSKPQALPADLVKLISQELEGYLRLSGADPNPVLLRILQGKPPEVVVRILMQEINKTGVACSINKMLELLPASDVSISPTDGPYISPQEDQLVRLLQGLIVTVKDRDQLDMSHVIMQSIWKEVFSRDTAGLNGEVTVRLKTQLCRLYAALCRLWGDVERCRVFVYHVCRCQYLSFPTIALGVALVWPCCLHKFQGNQSENPSSLMVVIEYLIMNALSATNSKQEKMRNSLTRLCGWRPQSSSPLVVFAQLQSRLEEFVAALPPLNSNTVMEFFKSYELMLVTEKWDSVIKIINDIFPCVGKIVSRENADITQGLIPPFLKMLGSVLCHFKACLKQKGDVRQVMRHVVHYLLTVKLNNKVPLNIQEEAIMLLLKLSHYEPQDVIERLRIWYPKHTDTASAGLLAKLEMFASVYRQRFPSLKKLFVKN